MKSLSSVIVLIFAAVAIASPVPQLPDLGGSLLGSVIGLAGSATGPLGGAEPGSTGGSPLAGVPGVGGLRSRAKEEVPTYSKIPGPIILSSVPAVPGPEPSSIVPL